MVDVAIDRTTLKTTATLLDYTDRFHDLTYQVKIDMFSITKYEVVFKSKNTTVEYITKLNDNEFYCTYLGMHKALDDDGRMNVVGLFKQTMRKI